MKRTTLLILALLWGLAPSAFGQGSIVETLGGEGKETGSSEVAPTSGAEADAPTPPPSADAAATAQAFADLVAAGDRDALKAFVKAMPKGADLHNHYSGSLYAETYLDMARDEQNTFRIDANTLAFVRRSYKPPFWPNEPLYTIDEVFADPDLYERVLRAWSIRGYGEGDNEPSPDQDFFQAFLGFGAFAKSTLPDGLQILRDRAIAEHVLYVETMLMAGGYWYTSEDDDRLLREATTVAALEGELQRLTDQFLGDPKFRRAVTSYVRSVQRYHDGIDSEAFVMRYVAYADRNGAPANVFGRLLSSFVAAEREPLIVGVNMVGAENGDVALRDYRLQMRMFRFLRRRYPDVHVALHAGELVPGMGQPADLQFHVREAVTIAHAERIGHAVDVPQERNASRLLKLLHDRDVAVEINLTSNEFILGVQGDAHPFDLFRDHGVPMVISTDDAGVARTDGLTHEFTILSERHQVSYAELKRLVYNSVDYAFVPDALEATLRQRLAAQFEDFERDMAAAAAAPAGD